MSEKSESKIENQIVDSTLIVGDLTDVSQISRSGRTVTLHGREDPRILTLPSETVAACFWEALVSEAAAAVKEDRQFFCVSFGSQPYTGSTH